jgi:hypothetical protein
MDRLVMVVAEYAEATRFATLRPLCWNLEQGLCHVVATLTRMDAHPQVRVRSTSGSADSREAPAVRERLGQPHAEGVTASPNGCHGDSVVTAMPVRLVGSACQRESARPGCSRRATLSSRS